MTTFGVIERLKAFTQIVRLNITGSPKEMANRLNVSESTFYEIIDLCKDFSHSGVFGVRDIIFATY